MMKISVRNTKKGKIFGKSSEGILKLERDGFKVGRKIVHQSDQKLPVNMTQ